MRLLILMLCCHVVFSSDLTDKGNEFEKMLTHPTPLETIEDFVKKNEKYIDLEWKNGTFLQIAAQHKNLWVFNQLLKLQEKPTYNLDENQRNYLLPKAIKKNNFESIYYLIGKGSFESEEILKYLYRQLIENYEKPIKTASISKAIAKYMELYPNSTYVLSLDLDQNHINLIISKIILTKNLPHEKSFLLPLLKKLFKKKWQHDKYPEIFMHMAKFKSSILSDSIEKFLVSIEKNFDSLSHIQDITLGVIYYLDYNQHTEIKNSEELKSVAKKLLDSLSIEDKLINQYFCLRILINDDQYSDDEKKDKIEKIEKYLSTIKPSSLEDQICLFSSIALLTNFNISIEKSYKKICLLHLALTDENKKGSLENLKPLFNDIIFRGVLDFKAIDDDNFALAKLLVWLKYSDKNNDDKVDLIKRTLNKSLTEKNKEKWKQKLLGKLVKMIKDVNDLSAPSVGMLKVICEELGLKNLLPDDVKNQIKENNDLIRRLSSKDKFNSDVPRIRAEFENTILKPYCDNKGLDLAQFCFLKSYPAGTIIFTQGDKSNKETYVVLEGTVNLLIEDTIIKTVNKSEFFGEFSLFSDNPRSATAITTCDTILIIIDQNKFHYTARKNPEILSQWVIYFSGRVKHGNNLIKEKYKEDFKEKRAIPEDMPFNKVDRKDLINLLVSTQEQYPDKPFNIIANIISKNRKGVKKIKYDNGIIRSAGELCTSIIFILSGTLEAKMGNVVLKKYHKGDTLGEINIFQTDPETTAEVISVSKDSECVILHIPINIFEKKVKKNYPYQKNLNENLIRMITQNNKHNYYSAK